MPRWSSQVNQRSFPLGDLVQHSTPHDWPLQPYTRPWSTMCSEPSARGFIRWRWLIWQLSGCTQGRYHRDNIGTCKKERKKRRSRSPLPKKVIFFSTKSPMIQTTDLSGPLGWRWDHSGNSFVPSCDLIKVIH